MVGDVENQVGMALALEVERSLRTVIFEDTKRCKIKLVMSLAANQGDEWFHKFVMFEDPK